MNSSTQTLRQETCEHFHTPHPSSYLAHAAWADEMLKTHRQARCAWCGLWAVWIPKDRKITNKEFQEEMEAKCA